jgi:D-methionine transport system ATP-binding protein
MEHGEVVEEGEVFSVFANPKQKITQDFINTTSNLSEIYTLLEENSPVVNLEKGDILVKMKYLKAEVSEPLISTITAKFGLVFNILFSDVEIIDGFPLGGTVGILSGSSEGIESALKYLKEREISVEVIKDGRIS